MPVFQQLIEAIQLLSYGAVLAVVAPLFPFLYVVMRWRAPGNGHTGIGTLGSVHYFLVMATLILFAGLANLTYGGVSTTPIEPELTRMSWGMTVGSVVFLALNIGLLWMTRDLSDVPDVRRMFVGFFQVIAGLTAFTVLLLLFATWFQEAKGDEAAVLRADALKLYGSWVGYFLTAYIGATIYLTRSCPRS